MNIEIGKPIVFPCKTTLTLRDMPDEFSDIISVDISDDATISKLKDCYNILISLKSIPILIKTLQAVQRECRKDGTR